MRKLKEKILELRKLGKSYNEICLALNCSKSLVSYHCGNKQKEKFKKRLEKFNKLNPFMKSAYRYSRTLYEKKSTRKNTKYSLNKRLKDKLEKYCQMTKLPFKSKDIKKKFGEHPKCGLTGQQIDWNDTYNYAFDHKLPKSRGGDNSLENLQILTRKANQAKSDMTNEEFIEFCKLVLENNGYTIAKSSNGRT